MTETIFIPETEPASATVAEEDAEFSFGELYSVVAFRKRTLLRVVLIAALASTAGVFLIPVKYTAEAVILTPQQPQPSLSALAQLAGLSTGVGLSGLSVLSGFGRNPSDLYIGILKSRTIADALIDKFRLKQVYDVHDYYRARKHLARNTTIKAGKDTLIHIEVEDSDPKRSAAVANAYVGELFLQNSNVALTEASQRRVFFEQQLAKEKDLLADAEIALRDTQQFTGLIEPSGQAEALLRGAAQLRAQILAVQAQMAGMSTYVTDSNPRFQILKSELRTLQSELSNLEKGNHIDGTPEVPVGKLPQAGLEYLRKYRDVKYHETLYEALAKQYEAARLDEAKAAPLVQVIDRAVTPERKSWPPRMLIILLSTTFSALICVLYLFLREQSQTAERIAV